MEYKTSDGSKAYVCKDCSKECALCGKKATKHYENMLGMVVFVCDDCYKEVKIIKITNREYGGLLCKRQN